ncbi:MAG: SLC26A/SulP transporter family protein, partial [Anaerolineales bacterium]|nr:SLC26A/SulP transporter family protein [Anaerolineales bacterium]
MPQSKPTLPAALAPENLFPTMTAGLVVGVIAVMNTISYGTLIFSSLPSEMVSRGIGIALMGGLCLSVGIAIFGGSTNLLAFPQNAIIPILELLAAQITATMLVVSTPDRTLATVLAAMMFSAFFIGIIFLTFGRLKLGKLIRFMPYPVFGGFIAGLGSKLLSGGFKVMTVPFTFPSQSDNNLFGIVATWVGFYFQTNVLAHWLPGLAFALVLFFLLKRFRHYSVMPVTLLTGFGAFFLVSWISGVSLPELMNQGWLLGNFADQSLWVMPSLQILQQAEWTLIFRQAGTLFALAFTSLIGVLFNISSYELESQKDANLDRLLQASGLANLLTSLAGGVPGYASSSLSILAHRIGARSRLVGVVAALPFALVLLFGSNFLGFIPRAVIGGTLVYLGLSFLYRWVIIERKLLPRYDYYVVLIILLTIVFFDILIGVAVGVATTIVLFAFNYSQIDLIRNSLTGNNYRSNVDRAPYHQEFLRSKGEALQIFKLQGYIFFGTAFNLLAEVRQRVEDPDKQALKYLVLDFRLVNGLDSSALNSFTRLGHLAKGKKFKVLFANLSPKLENQLARGGIITTNQTQIRVFPDTDHAVEWCEDAMLYEGDVTMIMQPTLKSQLISQLENAQDAEILMGYFKQMNYPINATIVQQGQPGDGVYFIERGQVRVELSGPEGEPIRLRTMGDNTLVGELSYYLKMPASATVITELPSTVYHLSIDA